MYDMAKKQGATMKMTKATDAAGERASRHTDRLRSNRRFSLYQFSLESE